MSETRPGWKTTEFWLVLLGNILINAGAVDVGGAKYRGLFAILSVVGYALARGLAKSGVPDGLGQPPIDIGDEYDDGDDVPDGILQPNMTTQSNITNVTGSEGFYATSSTGPEPESVPKSPDQSGD